MNFTELINKRKLKKIPNAKLYTRWGKVLDREDPLPEYPRPQMERRCWQNLNGVWDYAICKTTDFTPSVEMQGEIVVPFSPECLLSGVEKVLQPDETLYYKRKFYIDKKFIKDVTYLHFGAVDYECTVTLNGVEVGSHRGGFLPFTLDITGAVRTDENELCVRVTDPTDSSYISRGKQSRKAGGIWYTPQSGIWQTVWLESVPTAHVQYLWLEPDIDRGVLKLRVDCSVGCGVNVAALDGDREIAAVSLQSGVQGELAIPDAKLWSPESPFLYDLCITAGDDKVKSYFGMRKFNMTQDENGVPRLFLNNKPYFQNGLLDQGYWSDGLLTAPSDEALIYDIVKMKELGFNMLRKHIKIEPLRWYYHCDRLGMLVWQDAVNGGRVYKPSVVAILPFIGRIHNDGEKYYKRLGRQDAEGRKEYYEELEAMLKHLQPCVSLNVWVPFNEAWGQFDANKAAKFIADRDTSRSIDHASGWYDQGGGDMESIHVYFVKLPLPKWDSKTMKWAVSKAMLPPQKPRAMVLSEYGGYSYHTPGHVYNPGRVFGYKKFAALEEFQKAYRELMDEQLKPMIDAGMSAAVYTQVSDVEDETNGLLTFDREVCKF
ncbi:MAG: glycoside hydrolase family 2 [Oscillospiraceae bacterium]|nr:glycoside hydrolase family 2 [Oscillospiraceae bacterium]